MTNWPSRSVGLALIALPALALASAEFAWQYSLSHESDAGILRVGLVPEVLTRLHRADGNDWQVIDAEGRPVPALRLPDRHLTEQSTVRTELAFQQSLIDAAASDTPPPLILDLEQGQTRLMIRAPRATDQLDDGRLVFEALIANSMQPALDDGQWLILDFHVDQQLRMDCRLRDAADDSPSDWRLALEQAGDTRPRRYRARTRLSTPAEAWHLACYGTDTPPGLRLVDAWLEQKRLIDHRQRALIQPHAIEMAEDGASLAFTLDGPFRMEALDLVTSQANLLSQLQLQSRRGPDQAWQNRGRGTLNTMHADDRVTLALEVAVQDRHWRLLASPPLPAPPSIDLTVLVEEIAFVAQGPPPWTLLVGSRYEGQNRLDEQLVDDLVRRQGPPWTWPTVVPGERAEAAGEAVLIAPPEPVPWQRYLLWGILVLGSALVIGLGWRLLRSP